MKSIIGKRYTAAIAGCLFALISAGCGGGGTGGAAGVLGGSVGDGPVINGTLDIADSAGTVFLTGVTIGADAKYSASIPFGTSYPLKVTVTSGTDTVSGVDYSVAGTLPLISLATSGQTTSNVSPLTTLLTQAAINNAGSLAAVTSAIVATEETNVISALGMGASAITTGTSILSTPTSSFTATDLAVIIKATEAVGEILNRTFAGTTGGAATSRLDVINALATDMLDGDLDGANGATALTGAQLTIAGDAIAAAANVADELAAGTLNIGATALTGTGGTAITTAALATAATVAIPTALQTAFSTGIAAAGATAITAIKASTLAVLNAANGNGGLGTAPNLTTNAAAVTAAATTQSNFKLAANTANVTDFHASATARSTVTSAAGAISGTALAGVNPATALNAANLSNLAQTTPTGTAPQIQFTLANLPVGAGIATVTALLKDGTSATRTAGQRQLQVVFDVNWDSDGATLNLNAAAGSATATYFTAAGTTAVTATLTNAAANVLSAGTSVTAPTGGGTIINAAISNLFSSTGLGTALSAINVSAGQNYYYSLSFTNFPILDSTGAAFDSVNGTFSLQ